MEQTESRKAPVVHVPRSRRTFLKGSAAATGLLAIMAAGGNPAHAAGFAKANLQDLSDADILNFALTLEHLEARFYKDVVASGVITNYSMSVLTAVRDHEIAHVDFLTKALSAAGADPVEEQEEYNFAALGDLSTEAGVLKVAEALEMTGVGAYTGAAALLDNKDFLAAAGSIEQVEARHHGAIRFLNNRNPAQEAFGVSYSVAKVTEMVAPVLGS